MDNKKHFVNWMLYSFIIALAASFLGSISLVLYFLISIT
jgi:hypothetical protein